MPHSSPRTGAWDGGLCFCEEEPAQGQPRLKVNSVGVVRETPSRSQIRSEIWDGGCSLAARRACLPLGCREIHSCTSHSGVLVVVTRFRQGTANVTAAVFTDLHMSTRTLLLISCFITRCTPRFHYPPVYSISYEARATRASTAFSERAATKSKFRCEL